MPFASKFRAMMDLPIAGDTVGDYTVESVDVRHDSGGPGQYAYAVRIVLHGARIRRGAGNRDRQSFVQLGESGAPGTAVVNGAGGVLIHMNYLSRGGESGKSRGQIEDCCEDK